MRVILGLDAPDEGTALVGGKPYRELKSPVSHLGALLDAAALLLLLLPIISAVIPDQALGRHLEQVSPMAAGLCIQATQGVRHLPLTPWQGLGVTALWAAGALIAGAAALRFRDA